MAKTRSGSHAYGWREGGGGGDTGGGADTGGGDASSASVPADAVLVVPWSTGTGTGDDAVLDRERRFPFQVQKLERSAFEVVSAAGLGFPLGMTNVTETSNLAAGSPGTGVRVRANTCTQCIPVPSVGESLFYRFYIDNRTPDSYIAGGGDNSNHQPQDGSAGTRDVNWEFLIESKDDGTWDAVFYINSESWPNNRWSLPAALPKNTAYRFEWRIRRSSTSEFQLEARVYDIEDRLLYDTSDFSNVNETASLDDPPTFAFVEVMSLRGLQWGSNGWSVDPPADYLAWRTGGLMIRTADWCGPFTSAEQTW